MDTLRLSITLNFSNFLINILNEKLIACEILKICYEEAYVELNEKNKDGLILLNIIKNNLIEYLEKK
jgi:hypothetical protein